MTKASAFLLLFVFAIVSCSDSGTVNSMESRSAEDITATNDAIARFVNAGIDPASPKAIDFQIYSPDESSAKAIEVAVRQEGYATEIVSGEDGLFTVVCTVELALVQPVISAMESELDRLAEPHGGYSDGWGAFE